MSYRQAIRILLLSPLYLRLPTSARLVLVREFCEMFPAESADQGGLSGAEAATAFR